MKLEILQRRFDKLPNQKMKLAKLENKDLKTEESTHTSNQTTEN